MSKPWRLVRNGYNRAQAPWTGAIGIEEDDDKLAVPGMICWFTRGLEEGTAEEVVRLHNTWRRERPRESLKIDPDYQSDR